ncbi:MAG TPA: hypothetical protein HA326_00735 [Thermoplasmata archaeon]|nr:hypothetical protein [Thermoplasmata archaeon]
MSEKRDLAIVGLLLGLLGGALILVGGLGMDLGHLSTLTLDYILARLVAVVLGVGILVGSVMIYRGSYSTGGMLNLILGIVALIVGAGALGAVLGLVSGVLGLLANETRR